MARSFHRALLVGLFASAALGGWTRARAVPLEIRVRAPVRCELGLFREASGVAFSARLIDDRERGVGGAAVRFQLAGIPGGGPAPLPSEVRGRTDPSGVLAGRLAWRSVVGRAALLFDGDERMGACSLRRDFDVRRVFPRLTLRGPREVREGGEREPGADFEASVDSPGATLLARLWRSDGWREVATGRPDASGLFRFTLEGAHAHGLGPATLRVEVLADAERNSASADRVVSLVRPVELHLRAPAEVSQDGVLLVKGSLRTRQGGVEGAAISLLRDGAAIATVLTDRQGHFEGALPAKRLGEGPQLLQAAFTPAAPGYPPAASELVKVLVLPAGGFRGLTAVLGAGALLLALGLAFLLRRRPTSGPRTVVAPRRGPLGGPPEGALQPLRRLLRRLTASRLAQGFVIDGADAQPLFGVVLTSGTQRAQSDAIGRFSLGPLEGERASVRFEADGYAPELLTLALPAADERMVTLWPWREKLLRSFGEAAVRVLPGPMLGMRTPSELRAAAVAAASLSPEVRDSVLALVVLLEEACYSPRGADAQTAAAAEPHLEALRRAAAPSPSPARLPRPDDARAVVP